MLKGKVMIDIHNTNSGFTERLEAENMVTDGVMDFLCNQYGYPYINNHILPIASKVLGGLLLFDGTLEEDPARWDFPMNVHLTGFADQTVSSDKFFKGSLNTLETKATANGFTSVWDFSTSQCNGTIASLARTYYSGNGQVLGASNCQSERIDYNSREQCYYRVGNNGKNTVTISRVPKWTSKYNLTGQSHVEEAAVLFKELTDVGDIAVSKGLNTRFVNGSFDLERQEYYTILVPGENRTGDAKVYYKRYKLWTFEPVEVDGKEEGVVELTLPDTHLYMYWDRYNYQRVTDRKLYLYGYDDKTIYVVDLDNPADIKKVTVANSSREFIELPRGGVVTSAGELVYGDGTVVTFPGGVTFNFYHHCCGYLGTICNLPEPVRKTADKTMKITYNLTEV